MVPECKPEWNREAITVFSRLPSLRRLQATPLLQTSLPPGDPQVRVLLPGNVQGGAGQVGRGGNPGQFRRIDRSPRKDFKKDPSQRST